MYPKSDDFEDIAEFVGQQPVSKSVQLMALKYHSYAKNN